MFASFPPSPEETIVVNLVSMQADFYMFIFLSNIKYLQNKPAVLQGENKSECMVWKDVEEAKRRKLSWGSGEARGARGRGPRSS